MRKISMPSLTRFIWRMTMSEYIVPSEYTGKMVAAEKLTRCRDCKYWRAGIAYEVVGKCWRHDLIVNKNYYCADAEEKDG